MASLISVEEDFFKVSFPFSGQQHEVHSLRSLADAGLVGMALAVRVAEEMQAALDAAVPGRHGQPSFRRFRAAGLDASRPAPRPFCQLVEQLQACVDWRNRELSSHSSAGLIEKRGDGMAPLCGLLAAAASLGCTAAARSVVQINPSAVSGEWPCEGKGSAAHRAAIQGQAEALRVLLAAAPGAALARSQWSENGYKGRHSGWSPMHSAAGSGSPEAVQALLEVAPELVAAATDRGLTPLHVAAIQGHLPVVRMLLQAAPEAALVADEDDELPLHRAVGHVEVVRLLLAAAPGTAVALTDTGSTALHCAAFWGAPAAAQVLLQAAPEAALMANEFGELPLHDGAGHAEVVQLLLAAAPGTELALSTDEGNTALHFAATWGAPAAVQALLQAAPETALVADVWGHLPLHDGAGHVEVVRLLLAAAPGTELARTANGTTALHCAASSGAPAAVQALLQAAPQAVLVADDSGQLPLHCGADHVEVVQLLLAAAPGTAPTRTADGSTALHYAASRGAPASIQALLQAAPEAAGMVDAEGRSPLQRGLEHGGMFGCKAGMEMLAVLVAATPSHATLAAVAQRGGPAAPLFADFIAAAPPLTAGQWALVPVSCPRLGRALPASLARSHEQARQVVRRLPPADATRLRTFALALACLQRCLRVALPGAVAERLLCLCLAD